MLQENLFDLSEEEINSSKGIYNGKIIKCLVAPYHSYAKLEGMIPYTKSTYVLPEREMTMTQVSQFISMVVASNITDEIRIVTTSQNIIMDMIDSSVRILTEGGDIVPCPVKTFMANIHDIRYSILENKAHQLSDKERHHANSVIQKIIDRIEVGKTKGITHEEYVNLASDIKQVGEPLIGDRLMDMLYETKLI